MERRGLYSVAMPKSTLALSNAQIDEMFAAYENKQASASELQTMYGVSSSQFYRLLHENSVQLQFPQTGNRKNGKMVKVKMTKVPDLKPAEHEDLQTALTNPPVVTTIPVQVVVDDQSMVRSAAPVRRVGLSTWEISYTGTVMVEAEDIEEAIKEARKLGVVKRIYSAKVKR